ncbi:YueI family protein [Streptococcus sp. CSL10205-OR2]|uniref:YueI family protein n=1 Tax=Streptococcus sp. CSL10205-OR2 TaxID=2980558 RepID=UPI0021D857A1|nr:YueI family protein [Streptococcus sp. CSL10205-OR2]MCU9534253.1 YueI family protein [Streptococcus sp. CSL10205-OR2]
MTDLHEKVLKGALGEKRLNPDEQRYYLGTFSERVVLTILIENTDTEQVKSFFSEALEHLSEEYNDNLFVKISPQIALNLQMHYLKIAQEKSITATIIDEKTSKSPFGIVIHTQSPEYVEKTDIYDVFPQLLSETKEEKTPQKKSFFKRLFKK